MVFHSQNWPALPLPLLHIRCEVILLLSCHVLFFINIESLVLGDSKAKICYFITIWAPLNPENFVRAGCVRRAPDTHMYVCTHIALLHEDKICPG